MVRSPRDADCANKQQSLRSCERLHAKDQHPIDAASGVFPACSSTASASRASLTGAQVASIYLCPGLTRPTNRNTHRGHTALARSLLKTNQEHTRSRLTTDSRDDKTGSTTQTRLRDDETHEIHETNEANRRQERRRGNETSTTRLTRYVEIQRPTTVEGRKRLAR